MATTTSGSVKDLASGFEAATDRIGALNEKLIETAKKSGGASLDAYDKAIAGFVDYQQKGNKVEYLGHDTVDGDDALRLKVTLKNGDIIYYLLDPDTFLEIRTERQQLGPTPQARRPHSGATRQRNQRTSADGGIDEQNVARILAWQQCDNLESCRHLRRQVL